MFPAMRPSIDFICGVFHSVCFEYAFFCISDANVVSGVGYFVRYSPSISSEVHHWAICFTYDVMFWFFARGLFIHGVMSILFTFLRRVHVLRRCVRRFWFYGVYLLGWRIFEIPICYFSYCTWFCCCILISFLVHRRHGRFLYRLYWSFCYCGMGLVRRRSGTFYV